MTNGSETKDKASAGDPIPPKCSVNLLALWRPCGGKHRVLRYSDARVGNPFLQQNGRAPNAVTVLFFRKLALPPLISRMHVG